MSAFTFVTDVAEVIIDDNMDVIEDYSDNLPHHDIIVKNLCKNWNDANMLQHYNTPILKDKIKSCTMYGYRSKNNKTELRIVFVMNPRVRLTERVKNEIVSLTSAQLTDGWGESYLSPCNIMTDENNTRFYVE